ncbi:MAG TPA: light-harvesting protein [Gemmatimonadaceae bacterium]|nr:light-harvesting protein [Gemmatimonadaceae bacterium]
MNEGKIWTVVRPNHGVPLFLGAVALMAFTVHFAILNNTTWFAGYWQGSAPVPTATASAAPVAAPMEMTAPAAATPTTEAPATTTP